MTDNVVRVKFDGVSQGSKRAANETVAAIRSVGAAAETEQKGRIANFGASIRDALGTAAKVGAVAAGGALVGLGGAVAYAGFKFNDLKQRAGIAFETMLGSAQKAQSFLGELQKFAQSTPFEFPELIQSSQRLLAMGFNAKQVVPTLTAIGDAVAALGGSAETMDRVTTALGQIQAKGKASAEEMLQLTESGIPAWQMLADKIGKSVPEAMALVSKGAISSSVTIAAVTEGIEKRFGGMMDKQAHTFSGLLSTVKDTFTQLAGTVMAPFFDLATRGLQKIVDVTGGPGFTAGIQRFGNVLANEVGPVIRRVLDFAIEGFQAVAPVVRDVVAAILDYWEQLAPPIARVFRALVAAVVPILTGLAAIVGDAFRAIAGVLEQHRLEVNRIVERIGRALAAISTVLQEVVLPIIRFVFTEILPRAIGIALTAIDKLTGAIAAIAGFFRRNWDAVAEVTSRFFDWLIRAALKTALAVVEPFSHLPASFGGWARKAKESLNAQLDDIARDAATHGADTGDAWGRNYYASTTGWLDKVSTAVRRGIAASGGVVPGDDPAAFQSGASVNAKTAAIVNFAAQAAAQGIPYSWGGGHNAAHQPSMGTPHSYGGGSARVGFDCSGLISAAYARIGIEIPGTSQGMMTAGIPVRSTGDLLPGDIIITNGGAHAILYVGAGNVIAASSTAGKVVVQPLSVHVSSIVTMRRIIPQRAASTADIDKVVKPKATDLSVVSAPDVDYDALFGTGDGPLISAGKSKSTTAASQRAAASRAAAARKRAQSALEDTVQARIRPNVAAFTAEFNASKKEIEKFEKEMEKAAKLENAERIVRDSATRVARQIGLLPASARKQLQPKMEALRDELATVTNEKGLARVRRDLKKIQDAVKAAIDKLEETVKQRRGAFGDAFGAIADKALDVFDAKTKELVRTARATLLGFTIGAGELTPAEIALQNFQAQRDAEDNARQRADLVKKAGELAIAAQDETEEERLKRLEDLADAQEAVRQFDLDRQEDALERRAQLEREAADRALADEQQRIEAERAAIRDRFAGRLDEIKTAFENEQITAEEAQKELLETLGDPQYQTDFNQAGTLIGAAFAKGFSDALNVVADAVDALRRAVDELSQATGAGTSTPGSVASAINNAAAKAAGQSVAAAAAAGIKGIFGFRSGGTVPGRYVGVDDTILTRLTPGEEVIDRSTAAALRGYLAGGGAAGARTFDGAKIYVLGTTDREVAAALARLVGPELDRTPSWRVPRG